MPPGIRVGQRAEDAAQDTRSVDITVGTVQPWSQAAGSNLPGFYPRAWLDREVGVIVIGVLA